MDNKIKWYKRKEVQALGLGLLSIIPELFSGVVKVFPEHTLVSQLATPIGLTLSITWGALGLRKGYHADNLPSGVSDKMDKISNTKLNIMGKEIKVLGERGEKYK